MATPAALIFASCASSTEGFSHDRVAFGSVRAEGSRSLRAPRSCPRLRRASSSHRQLAGVRARQPRPSFTSKKRVRSTANPWLPREVRAYFLPCQDSRTTCRSLPISHNCRCSCILILSSIFLGSVTQFWQSFSARCRLSTCALPSAQSVYQRNQNHCQLYVKIDVNFTVKTGQLLHRQCERSTFVPSSLRSAFWGRACWRIFPAGT